MSLHVRPLVAPPIFDARAVVVELSEDGSEASLDRRPRLRWRERGVELVAEFSER